MSIEDSWTVDQGHRFVVVRTVRGVGHCTGCVIARAVINLVGIAIGKVSSDIPTRFHLEFMQQVNRNIISVKPSHIMSTVRAPSRSLLRALRSSESTCHCQRRHAIRTITTTSTPNQEQTPRWSQTPTGMAAPVRVRARPKQTFIVNEDPAKLDIMYNKLLGQNGSKMLHDETKWLAVTHKSFDQGRRGFNDRLSFMGKSSIQH